MLTAGLRVQLSATWVGTPVTVESLTSSQLTVRSLGTRKVGATVSRTLMSWLRRVSLPQASTAIQLRMIACAQAVPVISSVKVSTGAGSAASLRLVAMPVLDGSVGASQPTSVSAGSVKVGPVASITRITCTNCVRLPQASAAL